MKETTSKAKSLRKKMICLCEKRLKDLAIKIIRATSQPSSKKHIHVFKRKWTNNPKKLEYRKKVGPHIPDEGTDVEMRKMKWRKKKKKLCFCEFHLESIDEEMHIREELPGPIEKTNSIEKHSERDILESKTSENSWHEIFDTGEKYDRIKEPSLPNLIAKKITQSSLQEVLKPTRASLVGVEEKSQPNISFIECSENNEKDQSQEEKLATAVNQTQDDIKAGKQWVARSLTNISATVKEHSLEDIQLISRTNEGNNHDETIGSTMVKTQPTKNEENYSSEGQKIGPQQLKPGSEANVDSTRKLKQKKKVCFCEDILKKQILEDPGDLPASSDRLGKQEKVDRSNQEVAKSRSTNKPTDVHYDNKGMLCIYLTMQMLELVDNLLGNEDEIAIRERYVAEFSYEKYQEMQGLVDELLESDINGFENTHGLKEASKISDESKELPNITSCKKRCEAAVDQNRSINSKKPETAEATKDAIADTEMKQNKKACRYICNHLETAFYDIPSVIGLIASNELLSVCNEQEFEVPDTRTCNEPVYKVLYASDLKPIIEESYEEESKLYDKDQKSTEIKSSTKQYRRTMNSIKVVQNDKTCTRISDCYKNMICNRLSSLVLLDSDEHLAQSVASAAGNYFSEKLLDKITSDQSTQTKERNFIKNHSLRSTSTDEAFKRRSKSSLVGLWDSDGNFSLNTDYVNGMSNSELKATNDKFNERLTKTKGSKKANKFSQTGHFYEEQDYGTTINKLLEKKASLMILLSPDNHFETSKKKGNEIYRSCGTSYSTGSWKKGNINRGNRRKLKTCVARDVGCNIEECKENKPLNILSDQESQSEDVKFTTKSISTGVSTHIVSNQNKKLCIDRRSFEKYKVVSKHSLSRFTEPCQHFTDTEQVSETSDMTELKSTARHLKEGILNDGISRKPKRRRSVIDTITKYIAGAEKQIKKPFKKIGSYTEDAINKSASAIKSLDLGERLMSSVKQMVEMHISSEKKSDTNECKNLYDKNSGHISQAKKINLIKDQISAKITSCRISHDQQNERCKTGDEKASDGSMFISSNDRLTDIADKSRKVSNLAQASDYKNCSAKRRSCKGTQIKKAVITNQSVKTQRLVIYLNKKKTYS
nr:unnamed protein product [Callosobruchus chinensis]